MKKRWHITYNAPVTLTFALFCALVLLTDSLLQHQLIPALFTAPGAPFDYHNPLNFLRLLTHVFGHADWNHLLGNLAFILLLGPLMEERYGPPMLA
ncbi:MAG: rhomboid family intramembrane serine protease, partial [Treponemataceae bacterium]|nr:rhomboid family intramembrane serine protease [Treponemataceae bacterium]